MMATVLVVEDDPSIAQGLVRNLRFEGYSVDLAPDGAAGLEKAIAKPPDLMLLDLMLPGMNGFEVLREIRRLGLETSVIVLTAKGEEHEKVRGLDLGADDYITKPFGLAELLARVRAVLRRKSQTEPPDTVTFGEVSVDFRTHRLLVGGVDVEVTKRELDLLRMFISRAGDALTREEIISRVWGYDYEGTDRTLDNFVSRLRKKLERDHIVTVRGVGYRFVMDP